MNKLKNKEVLGICYLILFCFFRSNVMSEDQFDKIGAYDYSCEAYYEDVGGEEWDSL